MRDQLKFSFKKEAMQFLRTFKLLWFALAIFGFAFAYPLMYKMTGTVLGEVLKAQDKTSTAAVQLSAVSPDNAFFGDISEMTAMYNNAGLMFATSIVGFASYSLLIIMLVMMRPAGGEQKKRTMIVPMCSGLKNKNYLLPKFIIYPLSVFVLTFPGCMLTGALCNRLFEFNKISAGMMALGSLFMSVYLMFVVTVYLSLGLCTSRPGLMAGAVFIGQALLQSLLDGMGLKDYQPFSLISAVNEMYMGGYDLGEQAASNAVAVGLSLLICVLMYFLALGVLNAKKIDNQEEEKPAF